MFTTLLLLGKLGGQSLEATSATGLQPSCLFYVNDHYTGLRFLVDTSAQVSIMIPSPEERATPHSNFTLQAVNNTTIPTYGTRSLTLNRGLRRIFWWVFVIADVANPILGATLQLGGGHAQPMSLRCHHQTDSARNHIFSSIFQPFPSPPQPCSTT